MAETILNKEAAYVPEFVAVASLLDLRESIDTVAPNFTMSPNFTDWRSFARLFVSQEIITALEAKCFVCKYRYDMPQQPWKNLADDFIFQSAGLSWH